VRFVLFKKYIDIDIISILRLSIGKKTARVINSGLIYIYRGFKQGTCWHETAELAICLTKLATTS
jgi:hypothetical protein